MGLLENLICGFVLGLETEFLESAERFFLLRLGLLGDLRLWLRLFFGRVLFRRWRRVDAQHAAVADVVRDGLAVLGDFDVAEEVFVLALGLSFSVAISKMISLSSLPISS